MEDGTALICRVLLTMVSCLSSTCYKYGIMLQQRTWGRGTASGGSPPLGAGRRARRGSSSARRPPSPLLPDSVPGTELRDGAGLQLPFPPPPPPPLPQTEDAPWRREACVSSGAREWDLPRGAGDSAARGARACARAPASGSVCECARAPTGWGSRERRGREAEMLVGTEAKFFAPGNPSTLGRRLERASRLGELPAGRPQRRKGRRRARAPDPSGAEPSGARSHGCSRGGARSPLSRCPL